MASLSKSQRSVRKSLVIAALGVVLVSSFITKASAGSKTSKITWLSPAEGLKISQATGKPILYDFTAHWCGWCKVLDAQVFEIAKNARTINRLYVPVVVMDERQEKGSNADDVAELQSRYQIRGFPTLVVQYPNNGPSRQIVGFPGAAETMTFLKQLKP